MNLIRVFENLFRKLVRGYDRMIREHNAKIDALDVSDNLDARLRDLQPKSIFEP